MKRLILPILACLILGLKASQITIDPDGGYKGIIIKIDKNVPEENCPKILSNLKVRKVLFLRFGANIQNYQTMVSHDMKS